MALVLTTLACSKKEEEADGQDAEPVETPGVVITSLPSDQPSSEVLTLGTPASFKVLMSGENPSYQGATSFSVLVFDAAGRWINSDRSVNVTFTPGKASIHVTKAPENVEVGTWSIPQGQPSALFSLRGEEVGSGSFTLSSDDPLFSAVVSFTIELRPVATIANTAATPQLETCTPATFTASDAAGGPGIFSIGAATVVTATTAGCSLYADAACTQAVTSLTFPANSSKAETVYVKAGSGQAFVDLAESKAGFASRASCGGV